MATETWERITREQYLEFERAAEARHEFREEKIVQLAPATRCHSLLKTNLIASIGNQILNTDYEGYLSMRVKIPKTGNYLYPDICIVAQPPRLEDDFHDTLLNPSVIIEILSPYTEGDDRGEKFANYFTLDSITDYVLVSHDKLGVEQFTRKQGDEWSFRRYDGPDSTVELTSIGCSLKLSDLYHKVPLPKAAD